ncbi:unnamed protein product [marine sediment metagenome]|uniref:Uncharacterized protein n=1 Tax=marine sediment metagenome TaxID=412755 RepID=X1KPM2_9ZZZZ
MKYGILDEEVQKTYYYAKKLLDSQGFTQQLGIYLALGQKNQPSPSGITEEIAEKAAEKLGSHKLMKIVADEMSEGASMEQIAEALKKEIKEALNK